MVQTALAADATVPRAEEEGLQNAAQRVCTHGALTHSLQVF